MYYWFCFINIVIQINFPWKIYWKNAPIGTTESDFDAFNANLDHGNQVNATVKQYLLDAGVTIYPYDDIVVDIQKHLEQKKKMARVWMDKM